MRTIASIEQSLRTAKAWKCRKRKPRLPVKHDVPPKPRKRRSKLRDCTDPMTTTPPDRDGDHPDCAHYHGCLDRAARARVHPGSHRSARKAVCDGGCPTGCSYIPVRDVPITLRSSGGWVRDEGSVWGYSDTGGG